MTASHLNLEPSLPSFPLLPFFPIFTPACPSDDGLVLRIRGDPRQDELLRVSNMAGGKTAKKSCFFWGPNMGSKIKNEVFKATGICHL